MIYMFVAELKRTSNKYSLIKFLAKEIISKQCYRDSAQKVYVNKNREENIYSLEYSQVSDTSQDKETKIPPNRLRADAVTLIWISTLRAFVINSSLGILFGKMSHAIFFRFHGADAIYDILKTCIRFICHEMSFAYQLSRLHKRISLIRTCSITMTS